VECIACHFTVPEKGDLKGWIGVAPHHRRPAEELDLEGADHAVRRE
jgi:hypothetical protein